MAVHRSGDGHFEIQQFLEDLSDFSNADDESSPMRTGSELQLGGRGGNDLRLRDSKADHHLARVAVRQETCLAVRFCTIAIICVFLNAVVMC